MAESPPALSPHRNIPALTSLRFFAAAMIVFGHLRGQFDIPIEWAQNFPHHQGVSFFFVLSGFILTLSYPDLADRGARRRYLRARFARVWPLHALTFGLACLLGLALYPHYALYLATGQTLAVAGLNLALLQAWVPRLDVSMSFNAVAWSISVEAFFYVAFLWLIRFRTARWYVLPGIGIGLALLTMAAAHVLGLPRNPPEAAQPSMDMMLYTFPPARLFEFTLGMATAAAFLRYGQRDLGRFRAAALEALALALVLFAILVLTPAAFAEGQLARAMPDVASFWLERCGAGPIFAAAIFIFAMQRGPISAWLSRPSLVLGGEVSYAVYLVHQLLQTGIQGLVPAPPAIQIAIYLGLLPLCAYGCWRYVERPARTLIVGTAARTAVALPAPAAEGATPRAAGGPEHAALR
jgi:peptidoglycan/LPS O-acetylase OafA/YrhL